MASLIGSFVHLPGKHREQHALFILRKVASLVKPIMAQRGYRVGQLAEFFPTEHNLLGLNVNGGQKILLRLRPHYDDHNFLPLDDVVFTMLHELTHNEFGPHDEKFYSRLKELEGDYYKLRASGYSGEGFYSEGRRLGVGFSRNPTNFSEARRRALAAAEKRRVLSSGSGQKLGGGGGGRGTFFGGTPQQRAAAAAERRARDNKACGAGSHAGNHGHIQQEAEESLRNGFTTKAEDDDANEEAILKAAIELIESEGDGQSWREKNGYIFVDDDDESPPRLPKRPRSPGTSSKSPQQGQKPVTWSCPACTLVNPEQYLQCEVCGIVRPSPPIPKATRPTESTKKTAPARPINSNPAAAAAEARQLKFLQEKKKESLAQAQLARIPAPKRSVWECPQCTCDNSSEWWTCQACGTMKTSS